MKKVCIWELSKANNNLKIYWIYIGTASLTGVVKNWIGVGKYLNLMANKNINLRWLVINICSYVTITMKAQHCIEPIKYNVEDNVVLNDWLCENKWKLCILSEKKNWERAFWAVYNLHAF